MPGLRSVQLGAMAWDAEPKLMRDRKLWILASLSVLVHLMLVPQMLGMASSNSGRTRILAPQSQAVPPIPPKIRAGIERSDHNTLTWLGFEEPEPHEAKEDLQDQAAFSPEPLPGEPDPPQVPVQGAETPVQPAEEALEQPTQEPTEEHPPEPPAPQPESEVKQEESTQIDLDPVVEQGLRAGAPVMITPPIEESPEPIEDVFEPIEPRPVNLSAASPSPSAAQPPQPQGVQEPTDGQERERAGGAQTRDALESEKESSATSRITPVRVRPGRPAAAQGLDITTVRPQWPLVTRLSAMPRDPVLWVRFNREGRVDDAGFVEGRSTGDNRVDGPLLDAIFRWTAKGKAIDALPPGETILMRFAIDLGGGSAGR